jgi:hypothetical protein
MIRTFDALFERLGDRINPILVKETRQALKSRQFMVSFGLLLLTSLVVSFAGIALVGPAIDYAPAGGQFFTAYFAILAVAVFVVVPFGAYRSLASEQEERTYELLSITTLRPRQIVAGKLLSAVLQMLLYYSAIAPFMTFTYLLKGIDVVTISLVLVYSFLASLAFAMAGLLLATFARRKAFQVFLSVAIIGGLILVTIGSVALLIEMISFGAMTGTVIYEPGFWLGMAAFVTVYASYFVLAFQIAVSMLTFEADNRSSKVRIVLLVQYVVLLGWTSYVWHETNGQHEVLVVFSTFFGIHWAAAGACLVSEPAAGLSRRVQRRIPLHPLGRTITALFFPGPATGLAFLMPVLACLVAVVGLAEATADWLVPTTFAGARSGHPTWYAFVLSCYIFFYLALGAAAVRLVRRFRALPAFGGVLITIILPALGSAVPAYFAMLERGHVYAAWQISDAISTLYEITTQVSLRPSSFLVLGPALLAALGFLMNLPAVGRAVAEIHAAARDRADAARLQRFVQPAEPNELPAALESATGT